LVRVRVELAAREADDVRRVQARVLGVDGHEQLDDLARVERVEEDGGHLDGEVSPAWLSAWSASRRCWPSSTRSTPCSSGICRSPRSCWLAIGVKVKRFSEVMITAPGMAGSVPASLQSR